MTEKADKMLKKMILISEQHAKRSLAGQNTQQSRHFIQSVEFNFKLNFRTKTFCNISKDIKHEIIFLKLFVHSPTKENNAPVFCNLKLQSYKTVQ